MEQDTFSPGIHDLVQGNITGNRIFHRNIHGLHLRFSLYVSDVSQMLKIHMYQQLPTCRFTGLLPGPRLDLVNIEVKYGKFANLLPRVAIIYTYNQLQQPCLTFWFLEIFSICYSSFRFPRCCHVCTIYEINSLGAHGCERWWEVDATIRDKSSAAWRFLKLH